MKIFSCICLFFIISQSVFSQEINPQEVFSVVDTMPQYQGGDSALMKFISDNISYPLSAREDNIGGKVYVNFVVSDLGKVGKVHILKGVRADLDSAAIDVVRKLGDWIPGIRNGKKVNVAYTLPIKFQISKTIVMSGEEMSGFISDTAYARKRREKYALYEELPVKMPEFPGGSEELYNYVMNKLWQATPLLDYGNHPNALVYAWIDLDGSISDAELMTEDNPVYDSVALAIVKQMPKWIPAYSQFANVRVGVVLKIPFIPYRYSVIMNSEYNSRDKISFQLNLEKDFVSPTISCSCGNTDFFYRIYKIEGRQKTLYRDHTESDKTEKCLCKFYGAILKKDGTYELDPIKDNGYYSFEIIGPNNAVVSSGKFLVDNGYHGTWGRVFRN
ncbi:MAG: energy transducer TonB [Bacteroidia bacterium]